MLLLSAMCLARKYLRTRPVSPKPYLSNVLSIRINYIFLKCWSTCSIHKLDKYSCAQKLNEGAFFSPDTLYYIWAWRTSIFGLLTLTLSLQIPLYFTLIYNLVNHSYIPHHLFTRLPLEFILAKWSQVLWVRNYRAIVCLVTRWISRAEQKQLVAKERLTCRNLRISKYK